jgi:hypothetical protein
MFLNLNLIYQHSIKNEKVKAKSVILIMTISMSINKINMEEDKNYSKVTKRKVVVLIKLYINFY